MHFSAILWVAKILVPGFSSDFEDRVEPRGADAVGQLTSWRVSLRLLFQWQRVSGPWEYAIPTESLKLAIGMMDRERSQQQYLRDVALAGVLSWLCVLWF